MEQQKLPNATMIIVLGILGYLCCCLAGIGIIPSGIAYFMATKSQKLYNENPDGYDNYSAINTGKIVALIAVILNVLLMIRWAYIIYTGGLDEIHTIWNDAWEQMEAQQ